MADRDDERPRDERPRDERPRRPHRPRPAGRYPKAASGRPQRRDWQPRSNADRRPGEHGKPRTGISKPDRERRPQERDQRPQEGERHADRPYDKRPYDRGRPYDGGQRRGGYSAGGQRRPGGHAPQRRSPRPAPAPVERQELVGDGEQLIAGRRPVEEAFAARREAVRLLIVPERRAALDALAIHATTLRIPVIEVEGGSLTALAGFDGHQGVALVVRERPPGSIEDILESARRRGEKPFVLVLDSLEDPQNFGTLLRSAEACGVHGVLYPTRRSAPLSPAAIKASAGASEHLVLAAVDDLAGTLADLHADGLRLCGADEAASLDYSEADFRGPLAIVVGSEGRGISGAVRRRLDLSVRIPMRGRIASLNAAVAGSILLFAAAGQRPQPAQPEAAPAPEARVGREAADEPRPASEQPPAEPELLPDDR